MLFSCHTCVCDMVAHKRLCRYECIHCQVRAEGSCRGLEDLAELWAKDLEHEENQRGHYGGLIGDPFSGSTVSFQPLLWERQLPR